MNQVSVRLVFDRKRVATKKHQASVQMEVTYQSKRKFISTGIKLYSDQWGKGLEGQESPGAPAKVYGCPNKSSIFPLI